MRIGLLKRGWWLCVLFFAAVPAWSVQATLVGDAHVSALQPTVNSGSLSNLNVGGGYTSLMQFDFGVLPAGTTASQITRATLRVYLNRADAAGTVSAQTVLGAWNEGSVTYATMPPLGAVVQTAQAGTAGQFVTFDVTPLVQAWVSGATANNGVALTAASSVLQFDSKENDQTAHAPQLEIALAVGGAGADPELQVLRGTTGATGAARRDRRYGLARGIQGVAGSCRSRPEPTGAGWGNRSQQEHSWTRRESPARRCASGRCVGDGCNRTYWRNRSHWCDWIGWACVPRRVQLDDELCVG